MTNNKIDELNTILDSLDAINEGCATEFNIPSQKGTLKFSPITITHQHSLNEIEDHIWSTGAEQLNYIRFCDAYDKIIKDTCLDDIDVDTLLTIDRIAIALQHRIQIGKNVDIIIEEDGDPVTIDLGKIPAAIKKITPSKLTKKLKYEKVQITVGFPTLKHDRAVNEIIQKVLDIDNQGTITTDDVEGVIEDNFADILMALLAKHILEINIDGNIVSLDSGIAPDVYISAIQKLPLSLLKRVNESYVSYKDVETDLLTIKHTEDKKSTDILLDITTGLFTGI